MIKILAGALVASLLLADAAAAADPGHPDGTQPLWQALLARVEPPALSAPPDTCYYKCASSCGVYFSYCVSGTSQTYISTVCRPQHQRCEEECQRKC